MREHSTIDANDVQQLAKGESFWTYGGFYQRVQVEMIPLAKSLIEGRKEQLLLLDQQEREQYQAEHVARLARPAKALPAKAPRKQKQQPKTRQIPESQQSARPAPAPHTPAPGPQNGQTAEHPDAQTVQPTRQLQQVNPPAQAPDQADQDGQKSGTGQDGTPPPAKPKKLQDLL